MGASFPLFKFTILNMIVRVCFAIAGDQEGLLPGRPPTLPDVDLSSSHSQDPTWSNTGTDDPADAAYEYRGGDNELPVGFSMVEGSFVSHYETVLGLNSQRLQHVQADIIYNPSGIPTGQSFPSTPDFFNRMTEMQAVRDIAQPARRGYSDHMGHLITNVLGGDARIDNLFPHNPSYNLGWPMRMVENELRRQIAANVINDVPQPVRMEVFLHYSDRTSQMRLRPTGITIDVPTVGICETIDNPLPPSRPPPPPARNTYPHLPPGRRRGPRSLTLTRHCNHTTDTTPQPPHTPTSPQAPLPSTSLWQTILNWMGFNQRPSGNFFVKNRFRDELSASVIG